jgi:hypothetical protein
VAIVLLDYKRCSLYNEFMNAALLTSVLTGDLVHSERMNRSVRRAIPGLLDASAKDLRSLSIDISDVDVFRGDAWQVLVRPAHRGLFAAVYMRAAGGASSSEYDTRVAIGIGPIEDEGSGRVSAGFGDAFTRSGRALDAMPRDRRIQVSLPKEEEAAYLDGALHLLDRIMVQWTPSQARVVAAAMRGQSQEETAAAWPSRPISQQAVAQHLARAAWPAIAHFIEAFEERFRTDERGN